LLSCNEINFNGSALDIFTSEKEKHLFVIGIAKGEFTFDEICDWFKKNLK